MTMSSTMSENEWQQFAASGNEWQRVAMNDNDWQN